MENDSSQCFDLMNKITGKVSESTMSDWKAFVSGQLAETNERNTILPPHSGYSANSERSVLVFFRNIYFNYVK